MKERHYTSAPISFDWSQVVDSQPTDYVDIRGRPVRLVVIDDAIMGGAYMQLGRYGSGNYITIPEFELRKALDEGRFRHE